MLLSIYTTVSWANADILNGGGFCVPFLVKIWKLPKRRLCVPTTNQVLGYRPRSNYHLCVMCMYVCVCSPAPKLFILFHVAQIRRIMNITIAWQVISVITTINNSVISKSGQLFSFLQILRHYLCDIFFNFWFWVFSCFHYKMYPNSWYCQTIYYSMFKPAIHQN